MTIPCRRTTPVQGLQRIRFAGLNRVGQFPVVQVLRLLLIGERVGIKPTFDPKHAGNTAVTVSFAEDSAMCGTPRFVSAKPSYFSDRLIPRFRSWANTIA